MKADPISIHPTEAERYVLIWMNEMRPNDQITGSTTIR